MTNDYAVQMLFQIALKLEDNGKKYKLSLQQF